MLLAIDTATRWLGVAVHDGQRILAELGWQPKQTQTVELAPTIASLFQRVGCTAADLQGIGVVVGPGSYTGLRVGLGVAKGLSLANQTPLVGISTLDVVAAGVGQLKGQLVVVAEAGRSRVCAGIYHWHRSHGWQSATPPDIVTWEQLLASIERTAYFAGEVEPEAMRQIKHAGKDFHTLPPATRVRRAGYLAQLAWQRLRKGEVDDPASLIPIYLRDPAGS